MEKRNMTNYLTKFDRKEEKFQRALYFLEESK